MNSYHIGMNSFLIRMDSFRGRKQVCKNVFKVIYIIGRYSTVQYSTVQYSIVLYSMVWCDMVWYSTVTVQYRTVQYCTVWYSQPHVIVNQNAHGIVRSIHEDVRFKSTYCTIVLYCTVLYLTIRSL